MEETVDEEVLKMNKSRFLVYHKDFMKSIKFEEISYIFIEDKTVYIVLINQERYHINKSLNEVESRLDPSRFFRINRSFIVSIESIKRVEPYLGFRLIVFINNGSIHKQIVSREKIAQFKIWLGE